MYLCSTSEPRTTPLEALCIVFSLDTIKVQNFNSYKKFTNPSTIGVLNGVKLHSALATWASGIVSACRE
jgi:hypothetical protein